jgi:hypothetical protein
MSSHARLADLQGVTNRNVMVVRRESEPSDPLGASLMLLRSLSVLTTAVGLGFAYKILFRVTADWRLAWAALLVNAFLPGYVYLTSGVGPVSLGLCLFYITVCSTIRAVDDPGYPHRTIRVSALFAGLTAMTVWWGWVAVVLVGGAYLLRARQWRTTRDPGHHGVRLMLAVMVFMALVWPAQLLFSGPITNPASVWARVAAMSLAGRANLALRAFWGVFGWLNVAVDKAYYTIILVLLILGVSGLVLRLVWWYWARPARMSLAGEVQGHIHPWQQIIVLWALLGTLVALIHVLSPTSLFLGDTLLPLTLLVALVLVLGMDTWLRTYGVALLASVVLVFAGVAIASPRLYIQPAYARPQRLTLPQVPTDMRPLDVSYGDGLYLVGYALGEEPAYQGGGLPLRLYWLARRLMPVDYVAHVTVNGYDGEMVSSLFTRAGAGVFPTSMWAPGDVVVQDMVLPIDATAQAPAAGQIGLTVSDETTGEVLTPIGPSGGSLSAVLPITRARIGSERPTVTDPDHPVDVSLDGQVTLLGYDLSPSAPSAGDALEVTLYWRGEGPLLYDYTVFVHLVDAAGVLVEQTDSRPIYGNYPTDLWIMGESVQDAHVLGVPAALESGDYYLEIGMYRLDTGERLILRDQDPPVDSVRLGPLHIRGPG